MKICIIYHSYSGITRGIAERLKAACGGDLVEVTPRDSYSTLTAYTLGCMRARKEECDPIEPETIDASPYGLIVIGTPVWAFKATPAVNAAVAGLKNCEGKRAVVFATCGGAPGETIPILKRHLEAKGVQVAGEMLFLRGDLSGNGKFGELISLIKAVAA